MDNIIKYRQLDFLRLFRLCKNIGAINRKRKMPIEYNEANNSKSASKRLLRVLIKHLFPDCEIKHSDNTYYLVVPIEVRKSFEFINRQRNEYFDAIGDNGTQILQRHSDMVQSVGGFIQPRIPHEIKIQCISSSRNSVYRLAMESGAIDRPPEEFFRCALSLLVYKNKWDNNIPEILEFFRTESQLVNEREAQIKMEREERRRLERERLAQERKDRHEHERLRSEQLKELEQRAREERERRLANAQSLFNDALSQHRRSTDDAE